MDPTDPNAVPESVAYSSPPPSRRSNETIIEDDQDKKVTFAQLFMSLFSLHPTV